MKSLLFLAIALVLASCGSGSPSTSSSSGQGLPPSACSYNPGDNSCTMQHDNTTRNFLVHVPPKFVAGSSPLIVALHPSQTSAAAFESMSGWSQYVDQLPSPEPAVVYPQSLDTAGTPTEPSHLAWNNFFSCSIFPQPCPDDSDFVRQVILTLQANLRMNSKAVYVTGFSLGSLMAARIGIDHSDLIAAVGAYEYPTGTTDGLGGAPIPNAAGPVSVLYIDGDHVSLPDVCGYLASGNLQSSLDQAMTYWTNSQNDHCSTFDTQANFCTGQYDAQGFGIQTTLTEKLASGCASGTVVQAYKLIGGRHTYYCSNNSGCSPVINFNNSVCDAVTPCNPQLNSTTGTTLNDVIWKFFEAHSKP